VRESTAASTGQQYPGKATAEATGTVLPRNRDMTMGSVTSLASHPVIFDSDSDQTRYNKIWSLFSNRISTLKKALITGITGQDGAYLAEFLLQKGYEVHGIKRRSSSFNTARVDHLYHDLHESGAQFYLHHGDLTDSTNLIRIIQQVEPDEIYNLGAQSHVGVSFEVPEYTADTVAIGAPATIRHQVRSYSARFRKYHKPKKPPSTPVRPTVLRSFTHTGLPLIIARHMVYMPATVFSLTMNHRYGEKPS
jgi:hypothetical protein